MTETGKTQLIGINQSRSLYYKILFTSTDNLSHEFKEYFTYVIVPYCLLKYTKAVLRTEQMRYEANYIEINCLKFQLSLEIHEMISN
jgi:hypothetical protein